MVSSRGSAGICYMPSFSAIVALPGIGFAAACSDVTNLIASVALEIGFVRVGFWFVGFLSNRRIVFVLLRLRFFSLLLLGLPHLGACPLGAAMRPPAIYTLFRSIRWVLASPMVSPAFGTCGFFLLAGISPMSQFVAFGTHQWFRPLL